MSKILDEKVANMSAAEAELLRLRHTAEHVLHTAMQNLYPQLKKAMGPATSDGFYFDFELEEKISEADFPKIEAEMSRLIATKARMIREEITPEKASEIFAYNPYKLEWIELIQQRGEQVSVFNMVASDGTVLDMDLCSGPHLDNVGEIKAFKLLSLAGAYWHGDEHNQMLTRIYATAFPTQDELDAYLNMLEEAKKRDHKKLGKELDLFFFDEDVGKGLPMWTPKGTAVKYELEKFTRELENKYNYEHVSTPYLGNRRLYQISGHLDHYQSNMYAPIDMDGEVFYLRPMACPHHIKIYKHKQRSYKELPIRYAEIADYNRFEKSGELMGLIRVRKFQLTDAHIFVAAEDLKEEFKQVCRLIQEGISTLGLAETVKYRFSKHDPNDKQKYYPDPELWEKSEKLMKEALDELQLDYYEAEGEAAFYGPKLDIQMINVNGKEDTAFTAQIDFLLPEKFDLEYIDENGQVKRPVMIHRSAIGALERVFAFITEHYAGAFPVWLAPVQVKLLPIASRHLEAVQAFAKELTAAGIRAEVNLKNEPLNAMVRDAELEKVPYILVMGDKEISASSVSVRKRGEKGSTSQPQAEFLASLKDQIATRSNN